MLILSIACVSASDVNEISDNQDSNILNSYDSPSSVSASGESESFDDYNSSVGSGGSMDSSSDVGYRNNMVSTNNMGSTGSMESSNTLGGAGSDSSISSLNSDVSNDDGNSVDSISISNSNSNSREISSSESNSSSEVLNSSSNGNNSSGNVRTSTKLVNSGSSVVNGKTYYLTLKDSKGNVLSGKNVKLTFLGKTYTKTTNSKGVVGLTIKGTVGKIYKLTYKFAGDTKYDSSSGSVSIKIKMGTKFIGSGSSILKGNKYVVTLKNSKGKALSKRTIIFTINGKSYKKTTNSKGVASLKINLKPNTVYNLTYKYGGSSYYGGSSKKISLFVKTPTKLLNSGKSVVSGKKYYITLKDSNGKVLVGKTVKLTYRGKTYKKTTNSKGIVSLKISSAPGYTYKISYKYSGSSKYGSSSGQTYIKVKKATNLISSSSNTIANGSTYKVVLKDSSGNLLSHKVIKFTFNGKNYTKTTNSKGVVSLTIKGTVGKTYNLSYKYSGSSYYGASSSGIIKLTVKNAAVTKKGNASQYKKGLNEIANLSNSELKAYLNSSGYDSINSAIKSLASGLVSGKTTNWAKAEAIFNYVRDQVSYSFYSNSKKGATGTLSGKSANCCDQANLVVALCRAANIPARFSHGQGCTFSSGLVTGHVWAQINVDGVWYSADATSSRNSLGNVKNWNVKSFYSLKQYAHLPF